ncbi:MAG TPA: hypothetical protein VJN43_19985 [Bryobacteraceae bacterium]|nr:hypothetical protein [Bryobacteraceae bacterium]
MLDRVTKAVLTAHYSFRTLTGMAVLGVTLFAAVPPYAWAQAAGDAAAKPQKKPKDRMEYDLYTQVIKDAANPAKQLQSLDTWAQKYPESDFKDDRAYFYLSAYNGTNQPAKVTETAAGLLDKDLKTAFQDPRQVVSILYLTALNIQKLPNPTAEQLATGQKAARQLLDFTPTYFTADKKPAGTSDADWANARNQLDAVGKAALVYIAILPGNQALAANPKDPSNCAAAETAYTKALQDYPESAQVAYALAGALRCQQSVKPEKVQQAIYLYARAAALDPAKGGFADPKTRQGIDTYVRTVYKNFHGSEDGLDQLKQLALQAPLPPADFKLKTGAEIAAEKEAEFAQSNPQLALWMGIKKQLSDTNGEQYFNDQMKNAAVPKLKGTVVDGKPACRSKELLVAISDATNPEVTLKLDAALSGKPETGAQIQWEGVPSAFTKEPFMLTMDTEKAKVEGLKVSPCAAPARRAPARKKK